MNFKLIFAIVGIFSGVLLACSDLLYNFKGKGNETIGRNKTIESNWEKMKEWRFALALILTFLGLVCNLFTFVSLFELVKNDNKVFAYVLLFLGAAGSIGWMFITSIPSLQAIVYKKIIKEDKANGVEVADNILNSMNNVVTPLYAISFLAILASVVAAMTSVWMSYINISGWYTLLNPILFALIGLILKFALPKYCRDLPYIICLSLGMSTLAIYAIIALA